MENGSHLSVKIECFLNGGLFLVDVDFNGGLNTFMGIFSAVLQILVN